MERNVCMTYYIDTFVPFQVLMSLFLIVTF